MCKESNQLRRITISFVRLDQSDNIDRDIREILFQFLLNQCHIVWNIWTFCSLETLQIFDKKSAVLRHERIKLKVYQCSAEISPTNISMHFFFSDYIDLRTLPFQLSTRVCESKINGLRVAFYRLYYYNDDYLVVLWLFDKCVTIN